MNFSFLRKVILKIQFDELNLVKFLEMVYDFVEFFSLASFHMTKKNFAVTCQLPKQKFQKNIR